MSQKHDFAEVVQQLTHNFHLIRSQLHSANHMYEDNGWKNGADAIVDADVEDLGFDAGDLKQILLMSESLDKMMTNLVPVQKDWERHTFKVLKPTDLTRRAY